MNTIVHNKPTITEEEIQAVSAVLMSDSLIAGKEVFRFEQQMREYIGVKYAAAVNSGTSALHVALLALGVSAHDEVIVPTYSAADILNAIFYVSAVPVICDIEKNGCNIDLKQLHKKISTKTKAMIIPHTFGIPVPINELRKYHIPIVEDCAQALGSRMEGKMLGSFGDISIFSFYATKLITTGQGGMIMTNNKNHYQFIKDIINYNARRQYIVRYNYPMTDIAASIGNIQLNKIREFIRKRQILATRYANVLNKKGIAYLPKKISIDINPFRFLLRFIKTYQQKKVKELFSKYQIDTINPIKRYELFHNLLGQNPSKFPRAENFVQTVLSIPIYPGLLEEEISRILSVLEML